MVSHGFHVDETKTLFDNPERGDWCNYCACTAYKLSQRADGSIEEDLIHSAKDDYVKTHRP